MYESFYGCRIHPFSLVPDPSFLFLGKKHQVALSLLEYGLLNRAVFTVITGEPGTGKTTLLNTILDRSPQQVTLGVLSNTHAGLGTLMPWVLMAFGLDGTGKDSVGLYRAFAEFLAQEMRKQRRVVLVVDEAQNLGSAMLEELRLLSNVNDGRSYPLQIILSGQPGLRALLQRGDLVQFAQRISVDYHLEPFGEDETPAYIRHRLAVAGMSGPVFTELACCVAHRLAGGNARLINQVCDVSMAYGFAEQTRLITARLVLKAAKDRAASGILPLIQSPVEDVLTPEAEQAEEAIVQSATAYTPTPKRATASHGKQESHDPQAAYERGLAFKEAEQYRHAMLYFEQARRDQAFAVKADIQIALCFRACDRFDDATGLLRRLITERKGTEAERREIRYLLARIYEGLGQPEHARAHYALIYQKDPAFRDTAARLGQLDSSETGPSFLARSLNGSWFRSLTKSWVQLLRASV